MADNYLERRREDYESKKQEWLTRKRHLRKPTARVGISKPDDESL